MANDIVCSAFFVIYRLFASYFQDLSLKSAASKSAKGKLHHILYLNFEKAAVLNLMKPF